MKATSLIVVGTPFSGAALLGHALGAHSRASFAGERWRQWDGPTDAGECDCRTCAGECSSAGGASTASAVASMPSAATAVLSEEVATCLVVEGPVSAEWLAARLSGGERPGEDAFIVACVRAPLFHGLGEREASELAAEWRNEQDALVRVAQSSGRPLLVVRYEDLVARTRDTLARVCLFAGFVQEPALCAGWVGSVPATGRIYGVPGVDESDRRETAAWVQETLHGARDAVLDDQADEAIRTLRMLVDHFGRAFDDLGLELSYESLVIVLIDLLNTNQPLGTEAAARARALVELVPQNLEARRLLAVANANTGDVQRTFDAYGELVRMSGAAGAPLELLPRTVAALLVAVDPAEPARPAFLKAVAGHPRLAEVVDAVFVERLAGGERADAVYAALRDLRAARAMPYHPYSPPDFLRKQTRMLPSIWLSRFESLADWWARYPQVAEIGGVLEEIEDGRLRSRHAHTVKAWCAVCSAERQMSVSWFYTSVTEHGSFNLPWTETNICPSCTLNSRMRAVYTLLTDELQVPPNAKIYMAEQVTAAFQVYKARFPNLVGSEYLGSEHPPGAEVMCDGTLVRHEDHTRLSFATGSLDVVVAQDVFEHVADYRAAFRESRRVLAANGCLVFSIPFFDDLPQTEVRVRVAADGTLEHILPAEWHGNPLGGGSLCLQHFGWDILDLLREAGFSRAAAHMYWGPWQGHCGLPKFLFSAQV